MIQKKYNHKQIEKKWQSYWEEHAVYQTQQDLSKKKYYILDMFPYPSGAGLHVGHPKGYIATDIFARMMTMQGYNVLHPMGWDAFGLPAENYAIKHKVHPAKATAENVATFKRQLRMLGFNYDWEREINTTDPGYYKWTQWIFAQLFKHGLAYESNEPINWCPNCKTGLSNEDLENGRCERCDSEVEKRPMRQWMLEITRYADRLLEDLDKLPNWESSIKEMQRNWIGKKVGINVEYAIEGTGDKVVCFTTRPDTNFGATFVVIGPEHELVAKITTSEQKKAVDDYVAAARKKSEMDRIAEGREKTGVFTGQYCTNSLNGRRMPIWVADYVLGDVGTGAVVGVPGHDVRDFQFAQAFGIEVVRVVVGKDGDTSEITRLEQVQEEEGVMVNSEFLDGMDIHKATQAIMDYMEERGFGKRAVSYKLKDWVFSRQRYWGEPIPVVHCDACKKEITEIKERNSDTKMSEDGYYIVGAEKFTAGEWRNPGVIAVPDDQLPIRLPEVEHYEPSGTGESPLVTIIDWVETTCPRCGGRATRETNTMPQWAGSSWYYLRYIDPLNDEVLADPQKEAYWSAVDFYVGGAEHATRHLIYARFWHKFLYDIKAVRYDEPFTRLQHVGLIMAEDGRKMSKRWGNVINPDQVVAQHGADAMRVYEMFMGPFSQSCAWNTNGLIGTRKFLEKVWNLQNFVKDSAELSEDYGKNRKLKSLLHNTIKKVGEDISEFKFNTAVAAMMILTNAFNEAKEVSKEDYLNLVKILAPFAPYLCEEIWQNLTVSDKENRDEILTIHKQKWPKFSQEEIVDDTVVIVIQVNGKKRGEITVGSNEADNEEKVIQAASDHEKIKNLVTHGFAGRIIYVKRRLVNFVI